MRYIIARTAQKNPAIKGRTLYLTNIGFWTLDATNAHRFDEAAASAEVKRCADIDAWMELVA